MLLSNLKTLPYGLSKFFYVSSGFTPVSTPSLQEIQPCSMWKKTKIIFILKTD